MYLVRVRERETRLGEDVLELYLKVCTGTSCSVGDDDVRRTPLSTVAGESCRLAFLENSVTSS